MTTYCPAGHRVTYADIKPDKCPSCSSSMTFKPSVASAPASTVAPATQRRYAWELPESEVPVHVDDIQHIGIGFDYTIRKDPLERPMTIGDLKDADPIERSEGGGAPEGNVRITSNEIVTAMLKAGTGGQMATASVSAPAPARAPKRAARRQTKRSAQ